MERFRAGCSANPQPANSQLAKLPSTAYNFQSILSVRLRGDSIKPGRMA